MTTLAVREGRAFGRFIDAITLGVLLVGGAILAFNVWQPITVLPRIAPAPGYRLTDQHGAPFDSQQLRGQIVFYSFAAPACADCQQTLDAIAPIVRDLSGATAVTLLLDSSPAASTADWPVLSGTPMTIKAIVGGGFDLYFSAESAFEPRWFLVDTFGNIRARYHVAQPDPALLQRDIRLLTEELENSAGVGRFGYEAAHLFSCYPR